MEDNVNMYIDRDLVCDKCLCCDCKNGGCPVQCTAYWQCDNHVTKCKDKQ